MTKVFHLPAYLLDAIAAHSRVEHPREACGFLTGPKGGSPNRFIPIHNVSSQPEGFYSMSDYDVMAAYKSLDIVGHDILAVYHSHTRSGAELSTTDINEAWNLTPVYIVCSTAKSISLPTFRAWSIHKPPIGESSVAEVALDIVDFAHPDSPIQGLTQGNRVRIIYTSESGVRTMIAEVGTRAEGGTAVTLYPARGPERLVVSLDRIRRVAILSEGAEAAATRTAAAAALSEAAVRLASHDTHGAREAVARAGRLMPRVIPPPAPAARAYRPLRKTER